MNYNPKPFENLLKRYLLRQAAEIDKLIDKYIRHPDRLTTRRSSFQRCLLWD